ncbi:MAG: acyl-CoA dehydrogenase [Calditrichia bacterium]
MNFNFTSQQIELQKKAAQFCNHYIVPVRRELENNHQFPVELMKQMAAEGFLSLTVPKSFGGVEADAISYSLAMQEFSEADAGVSVAMSVTNMVAEIILKFGNDRQKEEFLPKFASGDIIAGAFGLTESNAGSNPVEMRTRAVEADSNPGTYRINGEKIFITNGDKAGVIVLFAKTDPEKAHHGITAFLVTPDTKGFSVGKKEHKLGLLSSSTVTLLLEDVQVDETAILGNRGDGFKIAMTALDSGRIGIASQAVGIAQAAVEDFIRLLRERASVDLGLKDEGIQFEIAQLFTELEAAKLLIYKAASRKMQQLPFTREASMAKLYATEISNRIVSRVATLSGWQGVVESGFFEKYFRDIRVTTIYEGTSEIQKIVIARKILAQLENS